MAGPNVKHFKSLTAGGFTPRGSSHMWPIQPVDAFTVSNLFSTQEDLAGSSISESLQYDITEARLSGQEQTESPGNTTVLVVIAVIGVRVTDFFVVGFEVEIKRDDDTFSRFIMAGATLVTSPPIDDPLDSTSNKPVYEMDPLIIPRLQSGATYEFKIKVVDIHGNFSAASNVNTFISKLAGSVALPTTPLGEIIHDYVILGIETY